MEFIIKNFIAKLSFRDLVSVVLKEAGRSYCNKEIITALLNI